MEMKELIQDLNCDMGEGMPGEPRLMPLLDSANISCGYHAGDEKGIAATIELALKHGVRIGAHVSFPDKENFGRKEMHLPIDAIHLMVLQQLEFLGNLLQRTGGKIVHVKPHGALYNMSARAPAMASAIAYAVKEFNAELSIYGLSGSASVEEARKAGMKAVEEVFADRRYRDDGTLVSRSRPEALIETVADCVSQAEQLLEGKLQTVSGKMISLKAESFCVHGDGPHAYAFLLALQHLRKNK